MAAFDWINNLFQGSEQMRGLSGGAGNAVALDNSNSFYNFRLRRHYTDGDLVASPLRLWFTNDDPVARTGLGPHVAEVLSEGQRFTDVLLVLSEDDYDRAVGADRAFDRTLSRVLGDAFQEFLSRSGLAANTRRLGLWVARDGADEIGGTNFGLVDGEFITGLVPNLYRAPGPDSRPVVALHVNAPGYWEGYREVGRLYDDQVLFTLGNHWLDNFAHPNLRESALYRLQRDDEGQFFHIINPDLQDRYQVISTDQDGTSVVTLATREGEPLAYLVLAVLDASDALPSGQTVEPVAAVAKPESVAEARSITRPPVDAPRALTASDAPAIERVVSQSLKGKQNKTIIPEAHNERIFTLQERGALLQRVHFGAFMLGYDVYLGTRGELGTVVDSPAATFEVRKKTVSLLANADGVSLDGERIPKGESRLIEGDAIIQVGNQRLEYRDLRNEELEGWPYVGEIRRPASSTYMLWGKDYGIGRSRDCRVVLPDQPRNDNIVWKPKVVEGAVIKSKTGDIPKARFYTDSIMVASEHGSIDLSTDTPYYECRARHCYSYVRRSGQILPLYPTENADGVHRTRLESGDEVLVGNCLFHVGFNSADDIAVAPAPAPKVSSNSLVDSVSVVELGEPEEDYGLEALPEVEPDVMPDVMPDVEPFTAIPRRPVSPLSNLPPSFDDEEAPPAPRLDPRAEADLRARSRSIPDDPMFALDEDLSPPRTSTAPRRFDLEPELVEIPMSELDAEPVFDDRLAAPSRRPITAPDVVTPDAPPPAAFTPSVRAPVVAPVVSPPVAAKVSVASTSSPSGSSEAKVVGGVVYVDDADAKFELGRPARLVQVGWAVNGTVTCGNHEGADLLIPENRVEAGQTFQPATYFHLKVRGKRGALDSVNPTEVRVDDSPPASSYDSVDGRVVSVLRRDDAGDEDFTVDLRVIEDAALPDPRARLVAIDTAEPLAVALATRGFPRKTPRSLALGGLTVTGTFDGEALVLSDYLDTYARGDGFLPFFVQNAGGRFQTAPEDGAPITLSPGDRLVIGATVWRFERS